MVYAKPAASFVVAFFLGLAALAQVPTEKTKTTGKNPSKAPVSSGVSKIPKPLAAPAARKLPKTIGIGIMSWQEQIKISGPNGTSYDATAQMYTPSVHYSSRNYFGREGILYEGYAMYGMADIQDSTGGVLNYFQKRVSMKGLGAAVGWFYRPEGKQVDIGVALPVQFRHITWTEPAGGYTVSKKDVFAVGGVLDMRWLLTPGLALHQRIGGFVGYQSALWMMNLEWTL